MSIIHIKFRKETNFLTRKHETRFLQYMEELNVGMNSQIGINYCLVYDNIIVKQVSQTFIDNRNLLYFHTRKHKKAYYGTEELNIEIIN